MLYVIHSFNASMEIRLIVLVEIMQRLNPSPANHI